MGILRAFAMQQQQLPQQQPGVDYAGTVAALPDYTRRMYGLPTPGGGEQIMQQQMQADPFAAQRVLAALLQYPQRRPSHNLGAGRG